MQHENMKTARELAELLGISYDGTLQLIRKHNLGVKELGMWWLSLEDVEVAKRNCR